MLPIDTVLHFLCNIRFVVGVDLLCEHLKAALIAALSALCSVPVAYLANNISGVCVCVCVCVTVLSLGYHREAKSKIPQIVNRKRKAKDELVKLTMVWSLECFFFPGTILKTDFVHICFSTKNNNSEVYNICSSSKRKEI